MYHARIIMIGNVPATIPPANTPALGFWPFDEGSPAGGDEVEVEFGRKVLTGLTRGSLREKISGSKSSFQPPSGDVSGLFPEALYHDQ